jgi:precorrin-2 dehydrogenase/sirohydrochlorin ferrochelatase
VIPLAFNLRDKHVVVIGAGKVAGAKWALLLDEGARITVIAPEALVAIPPAISWIQRPYEIGDLADCHLVIVAVGNESVNDAVLAEAHTRGVWANVVDNPAKCDFFFTAVHRDGDVVISVSSSGAAPALAQVLRDRIRALLPARLGDVAQTLRAERHALHEANESTEGRNWRPRVEELLDETP